MAELVTVQVGCCAPGRLCDRGAVFRRRALLARRDWKIAAQTRSGIEDARSAYEAAISDLAQHLDLTRAQAEDVLRV